MFGRSAGRVCQNESRRAVPLLHNIVHASLERDSVNRCDKAILGCDRRGQPGIRKAHFTGGPLMTRVSKDFLLILILEFIQCRQEEDVVWRDWISRYLGTGASCEPATDGIM